MHTTRKSDDRLVCTIAVVTFACAAFYLATPFMHADMISPLTTAVLGVLGALVIAYLNSFLKERYVRHLDAAAVASGLVGELSSYADAAPEIRQALDFYEAAVHGGYRERLNFRAIDRPKDIFYEANAAKLGLLGADLVRDVAYVYGNLGGFRVGLGILMAQGANMGDDEFLGRVRATRDAFDRAQKRGEPLLEALNTKAREDFWS
jgi:hypothetical protein